MTEYYEKFIKIVEDESRHLKMDDTINFSCKMCGRCCFNKNIMLNPYDIARLRHSLKMDTREMWKNNLLQWHIGENSGLPVCMIKFVEIGDRLTRCPFLAPVIEQKDMEKALSELVKEGVKPADGPDKLFEKVKDKVLTFACSVYPNRPAVCRMYPVGRCQKKVEKRDSRFETVWFMQDDIPDWCGDRTAKWTLKGWLDKEEWWHYQEGSDVWCSILDRLMEAGISTKPAKFAMNKKPFNQDTMSLLVNLLYNFDASPKFRTDWKEMGHEKAVEVVKNIGEAIEIMFEAAKRLLKGGEDG